MQRFGMIFQPLIQGQPVPEQYFLGPIVILPTPTEIILLDGQQRLATATILFSVIRNTARGLELPDSDRDRGKDFARDIQKAFIAVEEGRFFLQLGELDRQYFRDAIQSDPPKERVATLRSHHLIRTAKEFFVLRLQEQHAEASDPVAFLQWLRDLHTFVASSIRMVAIVVQSEEEAYRIFETLNDRGLRLAVPDLVLNYLMGIARSNADRSIIREKWNEIVEATGRRDVDHFLRHMWLSSYGDVKAQGLFREIRHRLRADRIDSVHFAEKCADECSSYTALVEVREDTLGSATKDIASLVNYLSARAALPLLLSGLRCLSSRDFSSLAKLVVALVIRHSVIANLNPSDLEKICYESAREIRIRREKGETSTRVVRAARDILRRIDPTDETVKLGAEKLHLAKSQAQYLLTSIANRMQSRTRELVVEDATIEHIFPENPSSEWPNPRDLEPLLWHIGNLTILGKSLNREARSKGFAHKKQVYRKSEIVLTQKVATDFFEWTPESISSRASNLVAAALETWPRI